ncbi:MAG: hypothetical protein PHT59_00725 [Candidatus Omnitrophica bacterium]|nr:hypothetical protein [Candidatus Omnitrophota bacterium]
MIQLSLRPRIATAQVLSLLERKGLIRTLTPPRRILASRRPEGALEVLYRSHETYGSHKLICVKKNSDLIQLNSHPDNEEFLLINTNGRTYKPLYIVIALHKKDALNRKIRERSLAAADFLCLCMDYANPRTAVFTMLKDTVHCEVTPPGRGTGPVFFVSEPSRLHVHVCRTPGYCLVLGLDKKTGKKR